MEREHLHSRRGKMPRRGRTPVLVLILCASFARGVAASVIPIAPEPVGSGARALGQSAFIAVADDATAASWNPAGLINLEKPEASLVGLWRTVRNDPSSRTAGTSLDGDTWSEWQINFLSYTQPIEVGNRDVVLSVNYHQVHDLGLKYSLTDRGYSEENTSTGAISAYSLAGGLSLPSYPQITIGGSFNWYARSLHHDYVRRSETTTRTAPIWVPREVDETLDDLRGYNFTFGILWDAYERQENLLTLGLVCHTPFRARLDQKVVDVPGGIRPSYPKRLDIEFPLSLGVGANYRFSDEFSTALDVQWTDWSQYWYTETPLSPRDDTWAIRLGFERLWFSEPSVGSVYAWRGGIFYEPRPAWSDILPVYGLSLGLGWTAKDLFSLDFAYQFRWGDKDNLKIDRTRSIDYGIEEHWLIGSVIVYFR